MKIFADFFADFFAKDIFSEIVFTSFISTNYFFIPKKFDF